MSLPWTFLHELSQNSNLGPSDSDPDALIIGPQYPLYINGPILEEGTFSLDTCIYEDKGKE